MTTICAIIMRNSSANSTLLAINDDDLYQPNMAILGNYVWISLLVSQEEKAGKQKG